jgi:hypothetical protein
MSSNYADANRYAQAAALREGAARIFEDCMSQGDAPKEGMYPFDAVGSYLISATFWHLAGYSNEANRTLSLAKSSLIRVLQSYPERGLTDRQRLYLYQMRRLIHDDDAGHWAIWKE